jgi:hypothetical protein
MYTRARVLSGRTDLTLLLSEAHVRIESNGGVRAMPVAHAAHDTAFWLKKTKA